MNANENEFPSIDTALEALRELHREIETMIADGEADISPESDVIKWRGTDNFGDYLDKTARGFSLEKEQWRKLWAIGSVLS